MNKAVSLALLVVGLVVLVFGFNASHSIGSDVSRTFTGTPTDKSIWLIVCGAIAAIIGAVGLIRRRT